MTTATIVAAQAASGGGMVLLLQFVFIIAIVYFLFILPQRREQKRHRELLASLKPGMEVVTAGGIVGEIILIKDDLVTLKSGDSRVVVERPRILRLLNPTAESKK
ncbi:MAG TPA: preprotein translocase subunit YajC [Longimicrobiaceae bacterium]